MKEQLADFLQYAKERAEQSEGTSYEWNFCECKYCLLAFAEYKFTSKSWEEIIDEFEALPNI